MKLIISTIVVGILLFLLGWIFYGIIFISYFKGYYGYLERAPDEMKIWAFAVGSLLQAFFLALIYPHGYKGGSPVGEGLKFGALMGMFLGLPMIFNMWGEMNIHYVSLIVSAGIIIVMTSLAGMVTGLIHGKKEKPAQS